MFHTYIYIYIYVYREFRDVVFEDVVFGPSCAAPCHNIIMDTCNSNNNNYNSNDKNNNIDNDINGPSCQ